MGSNEKAAVQPTAQNKTSTTGIYHSDQSQATENSGPPPTPRADTSENESSDAPGAEISPTDQELIPASKRIIASYPRSDVEGIEGWLVLQRYKSSRKSGSLPITPFRT